MNEYPRLCGGTFFTLLLQARKPRIKVRRHRPGERGERDGLSDTDVFVGLIMIFYPDYTGPTSAIMKTFKSRVSYFKSCKISNSIYLPLEDTAVYERHIRDHYATLLQAMNNFTNTFLDVGKSREKDIWLIKALLELIDADQSIDDEQIFYVGDGSSALTKATLRNVTEISLQTFLLGVWYFILINRRDNTIGKATFENWCPAKGGAERVYIGKMGDGITRDLKIIPFATICSSEEESMPKEEETFINAADAVNVADAVEPHDENETDTVPTEPQNQMKNNYNFSFQQFGSNNNQIVGNIETLVINND